MGARRVVVFFAGFFAVFFAMSRRLRSARRRINTTHRNKEQLPATNHARIDRFQYDESIQPKPMANELRTVSQVARRMRVDVETVRRWCRKHDVRAKLTPGGRGQWRIEVDGNGDPVRA